MAAALTLPTTALHASFLESLAELAAEGRVAADDHSMLGDLRAHGSHRQTGAPAFRRYPLFTYTSRTEAAGGLGILVQQVLHVPPLGAGGAEAWSARRGHRRH
jgi:hypothetical protein